MPQPQPNPKARASKLGAEFDNILQRWTAGDSVNSIAKALTAKGCKTSSQNLQKWINRQLEKGNLPPRQPSGLGRRRKNSPVASSLGILPTNSDGPIEVPVVIAYLFRAPIHNNAVAVTAMEQLGIPRDQDDRPDWVAYAQKLGLARLRSYGDMDYFTLAACFLRWKAYTKSSPAWFQEVIKAAAALKRDMIVAASG